MTYNKPKTITSNYIEWYLNRKSEPNLGFLK